MLSTNIKTRKSINLLKDNKYVSGLFILFIYYTYKMNIKTKLLEEFVNFVDNTKKQNKNLWICTIILVFIVIIFTIIRVVILS